MITNNYEHSCTDSEHDQDNETSQDEPHGSKCGDHCGISETCEVELLVEEYEKKLNGYAVEVS